MQLTLGIRIGLDLAGTEGIGQGLEVHALIEVVLISKERSHGVGSLLSVVERNLGEKVVDDMVVNDLVEQVASNPAEAAVDSAKSTLDESPCVLIIVRHIGVGVVQVSDGHYFNVRSLFVCQD